MTLVSDSISISFALHKAINSVTTNCNNWLRNRIVNYAQGAAGQVELCGLRSHLVFITNFGVARDGHG